MTEQMNRQTQQNANEEQKRLDTIAQAEGFASYNDYEQQLKNLTASLYSDKVHAAVPVEDQPTFWNELF